MDPNDLTPPNNPGDPHKVSRLAHRMEKNGWQGYPLVVHEGRPLNGSHRLTAAKRVGLENVPTMSVEDVAQTIGVDLEDYRDGEDLSVNRLMRDWYEGRD